MEKYLLLKYPYCARTKIVENGKEKGGQPYHYQNKAGIKTFREP